MSVSKPILQQSRRTFCSKVQHMHKNICGGCCKRKKVRMKDWKLKTSKGFTLSFCIAKIYLLHYDLLKELVFGKHDFLFLNLAINLLQQIENSLSTGYNIKLCILLLQKVCSSYFQYFFHYTHTIYFRIDFFSIRPEIQEKTTIKLFCCELLATCV